MHRMICPRCKEENSQDSTVCFKCKLKLKTPCPRCKSLNRIGQTICSNCNLRLIRFCPQCKTPNFPHAKNCRKCQFQLLKLKKPLPETVANKTTTQEKQSEQKTQTLPEKEKIKQQNQAQTETGSKNISSETKEQNIIQESKQLPPGNAVNRQERLLNKSTKILSRTEAHEQLVSVLKSSEQGIIVDVTALDGGGKSTLISGVTGALKEEKFIWMVGMCQPINQLVPYAFFQDLPGIRVYCCTRNTWLF